MHCSTCTQEEEKGAINEDGVVDREKRKRKKGRERTS